ncbi:hypothetical protein MCOR27_010724 [Pyricularia oryzae]|nr:hypothetical protein MCOR19_010137 [Pyricularia oryzae]KAI6267133.1 hypothetical protein MCOR27_010724 [Pyricularia oryzae]KAI6352820.1 hypothetical protein MCOR32_011123 [Pyricularia oryzae]KAI6401483.1 hypothetical protein MCOR24_008475 [Pyricularia oryzae]KAI6418874.1 hypothetical protein MCOR21_010601 [Pyricularia oryzae]
MTNAPLWYLVYNFHIILLCLLAIVFWVLGSRAPLLYSYDFGQWLLASPKIGTIIWTACGTIIAAVLLFLLKLAYKQPLFERNRPWLSGFTTINWLVALLLTTAFTTLLTPTKVAITEPLVGNELDFTAPVFWKWYNTRESNGKPRRKVYGCMRYTYTSPTGAITFPTCPIPDDPVAAISAGVAAAQESLGAQDTSVRIVDSLFKGSTGGVLPMGPGGVTAFNNIRFRSWGSVHYPQYNYSLSQQGLSARISCKETPETPISTKVLQTVNVTNGPVDGQMQVVEFSTEKRFCGSKATWVVSALGIVAPSLCQPDPKVKKYNLHLAPYRKYKQLPNLDCSIEPIITKNLVTYSTTTGLFNSRVLESLDSLFVPNETVDAVSSLFKISLTSWGSGFIDSILSLNTSGDGHGTFSYPAALEAALKGIIEYEGTQLRMYYAANEAPGRSDVNGTYQVSRIGYHQTQPTALLILLPLILYVLVVSWWFTWVGLRTGSEINDAFDPTNSTALITAAASGAAGGRLRLQTFERLDVAQESKIKYTGKAELVMVEDSETGDATPFGPFDVETSYKADYCR